MQRTQIYLDDEQHRALTALAKNRGTTASALIRSAIDDYLVARLSPEERLARLRALGKSFAATGGAGAGSGAATSRTTESRTTESRTAVSRTAVENIRAADAARLDSSA